MPRSPFALLGALAALAAPAGASAATFPDKIPLPNGFQPEGIASGQGTSLFVGSIATGAVWAGDARTGKGKVRVKGRQGRSAIGIKIDRDRIFVAGGATGQAYVYDAKTGKDLGRYQLAPAGAPTFVNDLVVTQSAVYLTDSRLQQLYVLPLGSSGSLPRQSAVRTLPLTGAIVYGAGNNANGIVALPGGRTLIIVQSNTGKLFRVDAATGATREIGLGGATMTNGDGLLLRGRTLYVVQNRLNRIAVIALDKKFASGRVSRTLTDPDFDVPTTIAFTANRLYAVNARFGAPTGPNERYDIVRVG